MYPPCRGRRPEARTNASTVADAARRLLKQPTFQRTQAESIQPLGRVCPSLVCGGCKLCRRGVGIGWASGGHFPYPARRTQYSSIPGFTQADAHRIAAWFSTAASRARPSITISAIPDPTWRGCTEEVVSRGDADRGCAHREDVRGDATCQAAGVGAAAGRQCAGRRSLTVVDARGFGLVVRTMSTFQGRRRSNSFGLSPMLATAIATGH